MEQYIKKFYENKPDRNTHDGPIPVSFNTQMKTEQIVKEYFNICQRKLDQWEDEEKDMRKMKNVRDKLMTNLKKYQVTLNDCIWQTNSPEEAEKCADDYLKLMVSKGFLYSNEIAKGL